MPSIVKQYASSTATTRDGEIVVHLNINLSLQLDGAVQQASVPVTVPATKVEEVKDDEKVELLIPEIDFMPNDIVEFGKEV